MKTRTHLVPKDMKTLKTSLITFTLAVMALAELAPVSAQAQVVYIQGRHPRRWYRRHAPVVVVPPPPPPEFMAPPVFMAPPPVVVLPAPPPRYYYPRYRYRRYGRY